MAAPFELFQGFHSVPSASPSCTWGTGEDSSLWELLVLTGTSISSGCVWSGLSSAPSRGGCRGQQRDTWSAGSSAACWQLCFAGRWFALLNSERASRVLWLPGGCSAGARCAPSRHLRSAAGPVRGQAVQGSAVRPGRVLTAGREPVGSRGLGALEAEPEGGRLLCSLVSAGRALQWALSSFRAQESCMACSQGENNPIL